MAASNPTNEAELLALLVADLREVCKANGLSHVGKKKLNCRIASEPTYLRPRVAEQVPLAEALPGRAQGVAVEVPAWAAGGVARGVEDTRERQRNRSRSVATWRWRSWY